MTENHWVYRFDEVEKVEKRCGGSRQELINLLGGKGGNLAIISRLGVRVPRGFTITTEACNDYYAQQPPAMPAGLWEEILAAIRKLEEDSGKKFGSAEKPLLVSCRSGARISMPGMMDTVLNIGLNDVTCEALARLTENPRFAWDSYRRLIQGFGAIVLGISDEKFESALSAMRTEKGRASDAECTAEDWQGLVTVYKKIIEDAGKVFPQDPIEQVRLATMAVFESWNSPRAIDYRNNFKIPHTYGTAVNIMSMVFGNMGNTSGTGVAFTRNPSTGERKIWGEYLLNAQGEDVVAGIRTADKIDKLEATLPHAYEQFIDITQKLEKHFQDMQDVEFTIEDGELWMLQTRSGKRTATAAVKIAVDMVEEGLITKEQAVARISPADVDQLLHPHFLKSDLDVAKDKLYAKGVNASPGAGVGKIYFTADKVKEMAAAGEDCIMVRKFTKPDDVGGMLAGKGVITAEGGAASHAAVVARQLGIPAVVGCGGLTINFEKLEVTCNGVTLKEGDIVSVDGTTGQIFAGKVPLTKPKLEEQTELMKILTWADEIRSAPNGRESVSNGPTRGLMVWANADTPEDAAKAREFGAEGVGLCRTEHMFLGDRAQYVQNMILAENDEARVESLEVLEGLQTDDFHKIFTAMTDLPTIIRLIDPPLHEFLPDYDVILQEVVKLRTRKELGADYDEKELEEKEALLAKARSMHESNPMIGTRGVRLVLVTDGLLKMQLRAILEGACLAKEDGFNPVPEIMIPLTMNSNELARIKPVYEEIKKEIFAKHGLEFPVKFGTMIEVPRACLVADKLAEYAEFFSFGTNDLHQMTLGISRDDAEAGFLHKYYDWKILKESPFKTIDQVGVGRLMRMCVDDARRTRPEITVGICGEHGGDHNSIDFCHRIGMNYVSCSPFRVPCARLSAAQAVLKNRH